MSWCPHFFAHIYLVLSGHYAVASRPKVQGLGALKSTNMFREKWTAIGIFSISTSLFCQQFFFSRASLERFSRVLNILNVCLTNF